MNQNVLEKISDADDTNSTLSLEVRPWVWMRHKLIIFDKYTSPRSQDTRVYAHSGSGAIFNRPRVQMLQTQTSKS